MLINSLAISIVCFLLFSPCYAEIDVEKTSAGDLRILPIYHASLILEFQGKAIHIDPWSRGDYSNHPKADLILITDIHQDHMDPSAINRLKKTNTKIVAPAAVARTVKEAIVINNGQSKVVDGIGIEAVPMYNLERGPQPGEKYHTRGRGNGYILTLGGKRIYVSGDTECIPEMKALKNIAIAFICMNLPYTMTPEEAADCVKAFRPGIVYPYHYRGANVENFANALKSERGIQVRVRNWYP